jgi:hypothetical protein
MLRCGFLRCLSWFGAVSGPRHITEGIAAKLGIAGKRRYTCVGQTDNPPTIPISGISHMRRALVKN